MPLKSLLCLLLFLSPAYLVWAKTYVWTDLNGQKIEAEFVRADESIVTISMDGQELDLPLDSLSAFSKALAIKLRKEASSGQTVHQPAQTESKPLYDWKDIQGRLIKAEFISVNSSAVKILFNGQTVELPFSYLSQESKNLARQLASPSEPPTKEATAEENPEPASKPASEEMGTDPNGPLDLKAMQVWISADGRALRAKFVEFESGELTLLTNTDQEVRIDQENLSPQAIALAKKLKVFNDERKKALIAFAEVRKKMKVPSVSEQDLDKAHQLQNSDGVTISANFIDADDDGVTITLAGKTQPLELTWDRFSKESQALLEALRRKSLTVNRAPSISPAKGSRLAAFANGPFKRYNTVFQSERFNAALSSSGSSIKIWLKNSKDPSKPPKTFGIGFGTRYTDTSNPEKHRRRSRNITGFESPPEPSMNREKTTISGTFNNGGTFQYDIQMNDKGLSLWSKMKDPSGEKEPTSIRIGTYIPGIVPDSRNKSMEEIMPYIGDGSLVLKPTSGKSRSYPFKEKWAITNAKYKGQKFGGMESATLMGFPYGNRISFMGTGSGMRFARDVDYGKIFPFQGLSLTYSNGSSAKEIPQNRAYKVLILPL
jgi:hypothetical protein